MPKIAYLPPQNAIDAAIDAARLSPCQKSKRGVVIFLRVSSPVARIEGTGYNRQPSGICDGACRQACAELCVHAETHAIWDAFGRLGGPDLRFYDALHVKVDQDGVLVVSRPPKCHRCSAQVLASGLEGFWLLQEDGWRRYEASDFHELSLKANGILPRAAQCPPGMRACGHCQACIDDRNAHYARQNPPPLPCPHPEHRRSVNLGAGVVCLQCGQPIGRPGRRKR